MQCDRIKALDSYNRTILRNKQGVAVSTERWMMTSAKSVGLYIIQAEQRIADKTISVMFAFTPKPKRAGSKDVYSSLDQAHDMGTLIQSAMEKDGESFNIGDFHRTTGNGVSVKAVKGAMPAKYKAADIKAAGPKGQNKAKVALL